MDLCICSLSPTLESEFHKEEYFADMLSGESSCLISSNGVLYIKLYYTIYLLYLRRICRDRTADN